MVAVIGAGFGRRVAEAVDALSKRPGEDYAAFIERVALNPLAAAVKRNDIRDNMDLARLPELGPADVARWNKYRAALARLEN